MRGTRRDAWASTGETFRPRNLLQPCLLILLEEAAGYGYELDQRLDSLCGSRSDTPAVYRALNGLEHEGLVASHWERSHSGPERRCYSITAAGRAALAGWADELAQLSGLLRGLLRRYQEASLATAVAG